MPRPSKYPLLPLREHRDRSVDAATAELGDAIRTREAADTARDAAERERAAAEARVAAIRSEEAARLAGGELRAADLAQAEAWATAARAELDTLSRNVTRAEEHATAAREAETAARAALAQKKADRDVVAKDEGRFAAGVRKARDAAEEEAADEAFAGRRRDA